MVGQYSYGLSSGMGNLGTVQDISKDVNLAASAAGLATSGLAVTGLIAGSVAGPIGLAIGGAALVANLIAQVFNGCGPTCTVTSQAADQIEPLLKQNLAAWQAGPKTKANQSIALSNFDTLWGKLVQFCQSGQYGTAGQNCVADRQSGACKWKNDAGECFNWFIGYRDPIANDPNVIPDVTVASGVSSVVDSLFNWGSGSNNSNNGSGISMFIPLALIIGGGLLIYGSGN